MKKYFILLLGLTLSACGYSEDEWQAQLARYNNLESEHANEKKSHASTQAELDASKQRIAELLNELQKMGVNVDELNERLQQEGTEKERLAADLDEMKRALDEYKQRAAQLERIKKRFEVLRSKLEELSNLGL